MPRKTATATPHDTSAARAMTDTHVATGTRGGKPTITRTWKRVDSRGNLANGVQTITIRDTTAPSLKLPANLVQQCPGDTRTNVTGVPIVSDVCGSVTISYSDVVTNGCAQTRTVFRTWTATDQCGNSTNGVQTISVIDTTKPTITSPNFSVQCTDDVPLPYASLTAFRAAGGTANDACSSTL